VIYLSFDLLKLTIAALPLNVKKVVFEGPAFLAKLRFAGFFANCLFWSSKGRSRQKILRRVDSRRTSYPTFYSIPAIDCLFDFRYCVG
jgi:hypothetical protein